MTAKTNLHFISILFFLIILSGCGGGGSSSGENLTPTEPETKSYSVTVINGYLRSATVWLDINHDGIQNKNEPTAVTGKHGKAELSLSKSLDPNKYNVIAYAKTNHTFDESLNQYVESDFYLSSIKGGNVITPFSTLVYFKNKQIGEKSGLSFISSSLNIPEDNLLKDYIANHSTQQSILASDFVRLQILPNSESDFVQLIADPQTIFDNIDQYLAIMLNSSNSIVIRDSQGHLSPDTDIDGIADTDDNDIDGDNINNDQDTFPLNPKEWEDLDSDGIGNNSDNDIDGDGISNSDDDSPYIADFNTIKNPGVLSIDNLIESEVQHGQWQYFTVEAQAEKMLTISLSKLSGDIDLYVGSESFPSKYDYQCRSNLSGREAEKCLLRTNKNQIYYIAILARQGSNFKLSATTSDIVYKKTVLLLHGLASNTKTWDAIVNDDSFFNNKCQTLNLSTTPLTATDVNNDGISCFNLEFGSYDRSSPFSAIGLDNKTCDNASGCNGDYTTFNGLGLEVESAIGRIIEHLGPETDILLFGHSRGGLAARSYLQNQDTKYKSQVKGLATTGTPHQGSPLGRFYQYMQDNCVPKSTYRQDNSKCEDNWEVVEMLNGTRTYFGLPIAQKYRMDMQAPSIDFLSPDSSSIQDLNDDISQLANITLGQLTYQGTQFGILSRDAGLADFYDLYAYRSLFSGDHPHPDTLNYVQAGQTRASLIGDGIVPVDSQRLSLLVNEQGISMASQYTHQSNTLHTEETSQVSDIHQLFQDLYPDLGWKN